MGKKHFAYFEDMLTDRRFLFTSPVKIITAKNKEQVKTALAEMQNAMDNGYYLAGYFAYELGLLFEPSLRKLFKRADFPLLCFGVFANYQDAAMSCNNTGNISAPEPVWSKQDYQNRFEKIMRYIRAGDVYQINLTFPLYGNYSGDILAVYNSIKSAQPVSYGAVLSLGGDDIISLSPELFFKKHKNKIIMRPMKGTIKRAHDRGEDEDLKKSLQMSEKNRAENLMIVDLLRNDLSRIANPNSVKVPDLFKVETYPSLHTMTSTIEAKTNTNDIAAIIKALFPCGSVTGAPKIRAMQIIDELENNARGVYCGAIGFIRPDGDMVFNVAIRTLIMGDDGRFVLSVGSGIVADSKPDDEYAECLLKASFAENNFALIETLGWHEVEGFFWLDLHLERLRRSAETHGFVFNKNHILQKLNHACTTLKGAYKIRLELNRKGEVKINTTPFRPQADNTVWKVAISDKCLDSKNMLLRHKTTRRQFIEAELARLKAKTNCQEVLFFNEKGELCEGSFTNVFVRLAGQIYTPPVSCGLLPGIYRHIMLTTNQAKEKTITKSELLQADEMYVGNALRGAIRAELV